MALRDDLVTSLMASLRPAVEAAVNEALGVGGTPAALPRNTNVTRSAVLAKPKRGRPAGSKNRSKASTRTTGPITRWVADRTARRVPNFVIKATGLDTKASIVTRYGEAAFVQTPEGVTVNGKPLGSAALALSPANASGTDAAKATTASAVRAVSAHSPIARRKVHK
jgi:hypothetical protein